MSCTAVNYLLVHNDDELGGQKKEPQKKRTTKMLVNVGTFGAVTLSFLFCPQIFRALRTSVHPSGSRKTCKKTDLALVVCG